MTGEDVSTAEVRLAAGSALYESAPLASYLQRAAKQLSADRRVAVVRALEEVIHSDVRVSPFEIDFFNSVATALNLSPAELVGL